MRPKSASAKRGSSSTSIYDSFVCRYGPLSSRENIRAFAGDPDQPLLLSLENYDAETQARHEDRHLRAAHAGAATSPADHVDTAAEALAISLNETGGIHWPRMAALTGRTPGRCSANLTPGLPQSRGRLGNRRSLLERQCARETQDRAKPRPPSIRSYERNVEALKAVQPADLLPGDISARLGSSWIPASDVRDFICESLDIPSSAVNVNHSGAIATWALTLDYDAKTASATPRRRARRAQRHPNSLRMRLTGARPPSTTRSIKTHASSISRKPLRRARPSRNSKTDSANGSGRMRRGHRGLRAITTTRSTICACERMTDLT